MVKPVEEEKVEVVPVPPEPKEPTAEELLQKCLVCGSDLQDDETCANDGYDRKLLQNLQLDNKRVQEKHDAANS